MIKVKFRSLHTYLGLICCIISVVLNLIVCESFKAALFFCVLFLIIAIMHIEYPDTHKYLITFILYIIWPLVSAFYICYCSQFLLNESFLSLGISKITLNMLIYLIAYLLILEICIQPIVSTAVVAFIIICATLVNFYVFLFRGSEFQPADIFSLQTAANVAGKYTFTLENTIVYGILLILLYFEFCSCFPLLHIKKKLFLRLSTLVVLILLMIMYNLGSQSIQTLHYMQEGSVQNGFILNFTKECFETVVSKPKGYNISEISNLADKYHNTESDNSILDNHPDVIVIMDESFADLSVLGDKINTNQEITPFIDSLEENTIKGYALSSVYGGGTPNSEFEFLTGNTMFFLPYGSIAYQQYIKHPTYSLITRLKERGYKCISMHPYLASGWERTTVYPRLGFDESLFIDSFDGKETIRDFVSDQGMFEELIDTYSEEKKSQQNVFIFGVTMQNHGDYDYVGNNFENTIKLQGYSKQYSDVEQYLSLIHSTDNAVNYLLNYFKNIDNDVVVVFFGDHLPSLDTDFYEEVHGGSFDTLDDKQLEYTIPFFIWANYDIDEKHIDRTSINYLSTYMFEALGNYMPEYNKFLKDTSITIPAINSNGYYSKQYDKFLKYDEAPEDEKIVLNMYEELEYNNLFDLKNKNSIFFPTLK